MFQFGLGRAIVLKAHNWYLKRVIKHPEMQYVWIPSADVHLSGADGSMISVFETIFRKALTPTYPAGCKRILFADGYFEAMTSNKFRLECSEILTFTQDWL